MELHVLPRALRQADGVLDPKGPLARTIPPNVLTEVNKQVKLGKWKRMKRKTGTESGKLERKAEI